MASVVEAANQAQTEQQIRDKLLSDWMNAKAQLTHWRDEESRLRAEIALKLYPDHKVGKNIIDLGAGYTAVLEQKQTKSFDIPKNTEFENLEDAINAMTEQMQGVGNSGGYHAEKLVKRKFDVSETAYKELPVEIQDIVDKFIVTKNSTPTLEIKAPKAKA